MDGWNTALDRSLASRPRPTRTRQRATRRLNGPLRTPFPLGVTAVVCVALGLIGCASAMASGPEEVRVLLYSGSDPIRVGSEGSAHEVSLIGSELVIDGQRVGARWTPTGRAPWVVGSRRVRGQIALRASSGRIQVLNRVPLEDYVASTVGGEMSPSWPDHALRAQAVAARTYVLHEAAKRGRSDWDVRATAVSQVYRGIAAESKETRSATRATRGEVLTYQGEPILAVFHSTAGGRTATAGEVWGRDLPYLRIVDVDEEDNAPHTYWRKQWTRDDLAEVFEAEGLELDGLSGLAVTRRTRSGRVERLEIRGAVAAEELRGPRLRSVVSSLGLRSTLFDVRKTGEGFAFVGSGYGHGVGMSQWGARALAERGESYQRILARFYPGTRLERWSTRSLAAPFLPRATSSGGQSRGSLQGVRPAGYTPPVSSPRSSDEGEVR